MSAGAGITHVLGALEQLRNHQRQLDMDGTEVGVSREALDMVVAIFDELQSPLAISVVTDAMLDRAKAEFRRWMEGYSGHCGRNELFYICREDDAGEVEWLEKFSDRDAASDEFDARRLRATLEAAFTSWRTGGGQC